MRARLTLSIVVVLAVVSFGLGMILVPSISAAGGPAFNDKTIKGDWGFSASGTPAATPLTFVIVDEAEELRFIRTDAGVASGVARRQR